jgi:hypothetical protein
MADFQQLFNDRGEERSYHKGWIYYLNHSKDTIFRKVKLKTRGNFRRDPQNCKYPPIMVNFGKEMERDTLFVDQSKLKLVIQCQIEKYVLLEYLAYRIYNVVTPKSYRVRLAHISYVDINTKDQYATRYGFFIQSRDHLEDKFDAKNFKSNVVQYMFERDEVITLALFQYLIGNDDWYFTSKHNITVLRRRETEELMAFPYDFDWSKLVNAQYTKPKGVGENMLRERQVYKGLCMEQAELDYQKQLYNSKKDSILSLVDQVPLLSAGDRKKARNLINQFFKTLNRPKALSTVFQEQKCVEAQNLGH